MNNLIIGFYGASNNGKTHTLNELINLLKAEENALLNTDQTKSFEYNGKKIGISTHGDSGSVVKEQLGNLIKKDKCSIIITACRTSGSTHDAIEFYRDKYNIEYVTCPYLFLTNNETPTDVQLKRIYTSSAIFLKSYIDNYMRG